MLDRTSFYQLAFGKKLFDKKGLLKNNEVKYFCPSGYYFHRDLKECFLWECKTSIKKCCHHSLLRIQKVFLEGGDFNLCAQNYPSAIVTLQSQKLAICWPCMFFH